MPVYTFLDTKTGEEYDKTMSWTELDTFLEENKHIQRIYKMNIADSVTIGVSKPPIDFQRHVLSKVKEIPGANKAAIEKRWVCPKEV